MPVELDEENIRFTFSDEWRVCSFEKHPDAVKHVGKVSHRKVVDFVGLFDGRLYLIEVKDFRGARVENRLRLRAGELAEEVVQKAFDTLAGLVLAHRRNKDEPLWADALAALQPGGRTPVVALWLEDDQAWRATPSDRAGSHVLMSRLKKRCMTLDSRAALGHAAGHTLPSVTATNLPGAGQS